MRLRCAIDAVDLSDVTLVESLQIIQDSTQEISTAQINLLQVGRGFNAVGRYDEALYDSSAVYGWQITEWQEIRLWDEDSGSLLFGGFVLDIHTVPTGPHVIFELKCSDYGILLDRRIVNRTWPGGTSDATIFADCLALVPEIAAGTLVAQVADLGELEAKDRRIRDVFDVVCQLTGGEWHPTYDGKVNYYKIGSLPAPFSISDEPDNVTSVGFSLENYSRDLSEGANKVTVLGALVDGVEVVGYAEDVDSIGDYGPLELVIPNRQMTDAVTANLYAQTQVLALARPQINLIVTVWRPGLMRGQTLNVFSVRLGIDAAYIVRTLTITIPAPDRKRAGGPGHVLKYTATLGARPPDAVYLLRRMQRQPVERTTMPFSGATAAFTLADGRVVEIRGGIVARVSLSAAEGATNESTA